MSIPIDTTAVQAYLAGSVLQGAISLPNSGLGLLFGNGRVLDLRANRILTVKESASAIEVARRRLMREYAELAALSGGTTFMQDRPATVEESFDLEVADFIPSVPVTDASPEERDEARQRRTLVIEEGWEE